MNYPMKSLYKYFTSGCVVKGYLYSSTTPQIIIPIKQDFIEAIEGYTKLYNDNLRTAYSEEYILDHINTFSTVLKCIVD